MPTPEETRDPPTRRDVVAETFHGTEVADPYRWFEADGGPFLLRTWTDTGHGSGETTDALVAAQVDEWTFRYDCLGIEP